MQFTILIDNREKLPWTFESVQQAGYPVRLAVTRNATADYSIEGGTDLIAIERKSLVDFQGTMGLATDMAGNRKRDRFEREIARMQDIQQSYIVVEAPLSRVLRAGEAIKGQLAKLLLIRAILRLKKRYTRTRWIFARDRAEAETLSYLLMAKAAKRLKRP